MAPEERRLLVARIGHLREGAIFRGSSALSTSLLIVAAGGAVFWAIAARVTASHNVGRVAALSSVITFLVFLTALGLVPTVARFGAEPDRSSRVVHNLALLAASVSGAAFAALFAVSTWAMGLDQFLPIHSPVGVALMAAIAAGAAFTVVVEIRLLSQRRYGWIIGRATVTSIVSVVMVAVAPVDDAPLLLFAIGSGASALSGPVIWLLAERGQRDRFVLGPIPDDKRAMIGYLAVSWTGTVVGKVAGVALPLVVALRVSADDNARFFVAWNIALVVFVLVQSVGTALLADGGRTSSLVGQTGHSILIGTALAAVLVAGTELGAPLVGRAYGAEYAAGADVLRILVLAAFPLVFFATANAVAQVRHMSRMILALPMLLTVSVYVPIVLSPGEMTITGAAVSWVIGSTVVGVASVLLLLAVRNLPHVAVPRGTMAQPVQPHEVPAP